jgi:hypothetical protein
MASKPKHPPGPPMTLGSIREYSLGNEKLADLFYSVSRVIVDALDEAGYYDLIMPPAR